METLREILNSRFGGVLMAGAHDQEEGRCCGLELLSVYQGVPWMDDPRALGVADIRPLDDGPWSSDALRTEAMLPMLAVLRAPGPWLQEVIIRTVREIISELPGLSDRPRLQARAVQNIHEAQAAAAEAESEAEAASAADAASAAAQARSAASAWRTWRAWEEEDAGAGVPPISDGWKAWALAAWSEAAYFATAAHAASAATEAAWAWAGTAHSSADKVLSHACRIWTEELSR
jgi:hypothetical protein